MTEFFEKADKLYPANILQLTSVRFCVACLIMLRHYVQLTPIQFPIAATGLDSKSPLLVDFFFILSGFILTHVYMGEIAKKTFSLRDYWVRRFARAYPVHLFTLALSIGAMVWAVRYIPSSLPPLSESLSPPVILAHIFLVQGWGFIKSIPLFLNRPAWSLSVEWFIYLFFPFLVAGVLRLREGAFYLFAIALYAICHYLSVHFSLYPDGIGFPDMTSPWILARCLSGFLVGVALCRVGYRWQIKPRYCGHISFLILIVSLFIMAHFRVSDYFLLPLLPLVVLVLAEQARKNMKGLMVSPALVYLGKTSYALYMVHFVIGTPVFMVVCAHFYFEGVLSYPLIYALWSWMFPVALVAGIVTYELVDKPGRTFFVKKLSRQKAARAGGNVGGL